MTSNTIAIDPGTTESGVCVFHGDTLTGSYVTNNLMLRNQLGIQRSRRERPQVVIEMIASYGMAVGKETFETCVWIGRFDEACGGADRLFRKDIKMHLCGSARAKDANVWQAILDRYGGKESAVGRKKNPGPLYGVKSHARAALAVGLCWLDGVRSEGL
jgi:hypothetical protein